MNEGPTVTHYLFNTSIDAFRKWLSELNGNEFTTDNFPQEANQFYYLFRYRNDNLVLCSQRVAQMFNSFENNLERVVFRDDPEVYLEYSLDTTYEQPAFDSDEESDDEEYDYDA